MHFKHLELCPRAAPHPAFRGALHCTAEGVNAGADYDAIEQNIKMPSNTHSQESVMLSSHSFMLPTSHKT